MTNNLVVNGCSYTQDGNHGKFWAQVVQQELAPSLYINLARGGAGNSYIANSTIDYLERASLNPKDTTVIVMWSGTGRKDLRIAGSWYYHLQENYSFNAKSDIPQSEDEYYVFSGGISNSWQQNSVTKDIFNWLYKTSDPQTLCKDSIMHFINLENYLKVHGYRYLFTSYANYWREDQESCPLSADYSIGYFLKDSPVYQNFNFENWFFVDDQRNCFAEFATDRNEMNSDTHPTHDGHALFAQEVVLPKIRMCSATNTA